MGYIITKQSYPPLLPPRRVQMGRWHLRRTQAGQARDSGILYNIQGEDKVWPRSIEFQIKEGETGDFWLTDGAALTGPDNKRVTGPTGNVHQHRPHQQGPAEERSWLSQHLRRTRKAIRPEWNVLEVVVDDKHITQYVNGELANVGTDPFPTEGKVLFQSEGARRSTSAIFSCRR